MRRQPSMPALPQLRQQQNDNEAPAMSFGSGLVAGNIMLSCYQNNTEVDHWAAGDASGSGVWFRPLANTGYGGMVCGFGEVQSGGATTWWPSSHSDSWGASVMAEFEVPGLFASGEGITVHRIHRWGYSTQNPRRLVLRANALDEWSYLLLWGGSNVAGRPGGMFAAVRADRCRVAWAQYTKCMIAVLLCPPHHRPVIQVTGSGYSCHFVVAQVS